MRARMPHLQLWKGKWRVRKPIPKSVQAMLGRGQYLTRSLGTANPAEANRLAAAVIAEFEEMIRLAEKGEWPPIDDERLCDIASEWWRWLLKGLAKRLNLSVGIVS